MKEMINKKILILMSLILFLPLFVGCWGVPPTNQSPTITSTPITVATVDVLYTYDVEATDPDDGDVLTYSLTINPSGMTIDSTTGVISWTPNSGQTGDNNVTVEVSDGSLSDTQSFTIIVSEASPVAPSSPINRTPTITSTPGTLATVDILYVYDVNATDLDGDTLTYSLTTNPTGMTIDSTTGVISWTPTFAQIGDYNVTVKVSDGDKYDTQSFIITVHDILDHIVVLPEAMNLYEGDSGTITSIIAHYNNGDTTNIAFGDCNYNSNTPAIATVDATGEITAIAPGSATITVSYTEGGITKTDTVVVTVNAIELTSILVLPETMTMFVGENETITSITASYNYGPDANIALAACTYVSDDEGVATVATGVITGVGAGSATITVSYTEGGITRTDTVVVTVNAKLENILVLPETMTMFVGENETITSITASYNYGPDANIALAACTYVSDDEGVATVATGVITGVGAGSATITVSYTEGGITKTDTVVVTVNAIELTSILVLPETMTMFVGENETITSITASYNYGPDANIALAACTYVSDDEGVATVATGVITGVGAGSATITVSYTEGGITKTDTVVVTVNAIELTSILVLPETMTMFVGENETITSITASYNYGPDANIALAACTYVSDDEGVATVATGVITGVGAGSATITVSYTEGGITRTDTVVVTVNAPPNLELTPASQSVAMGNQATINVVVEDVTDLRGANVTLNFDASKLQYDLCAPGGFIPSAVLMVKSIDNTNGTVTLDIAGLGASAHASGTGTIITVSFYTIATGNADITFGTTTLRDKDNVDITHTKGSGCSVTIN